MTSGKGASIPAARSTMPNGFGARRACASPDAEYRTVTGSLDGALGRAEAVLMEELDQITLADFIAAAQRDGRA